MTKNEYVLEYWEHGVRPAPTALITTLLDENENLLWLTRLSSASYTSTYLWFGIAGLALLGLFGIGAPWGQSLAEYCGQSSEYSCRKLYNVLSIAVFVFPLISLYFFGQAWKAKRSPWVLTYAVTTKRAIVLDEREPNSIRSVNLDRHPAQPGTNGQVRFGPTKKPIVLFAKIEPQAAERASYWANVGRLEPEFQVGSHP